MGNFFDGLRRMFTLPASVRERVLEQVRPDLETLIEDTLPTTCARRATVKSALLDGTIDTLKRKMGG